MVGTSIGQYRVVELLGSGSMGVVYKAVDETLDREVAIKVLNPELTDAELIRRFRTEATALAKLNHPEIATIYELRTADQNFLMVTEFVRGESLDKVLEGSGALPVETVAYIVDRVLSALGHAHEAGIVHRDIKPANVMLTATGGIKVMDFGIAFMRGANQSGGGMLGTPGYMPPEQIRGHGIDGRSDLYAVGVIFYRLLTGAFPFKAHTIEDMLRKQLSGLPTTPLNHYRGGLPVWCEQILERALAGSPSERFQTAAEFRSALKQATRAVPDRTARLSVSELARLGVARPKAPAAASPKIKTVALDKTVAQKRTQVRWKGAAFAIVAVGVVALVYFAQSRLARGRDSSVEPSDSTVPSTSRLLPSALQPIVPSALPPPSAVILPPSPGKAASKRVINPERPLAASVSVIPKNESPLEASPPDPSPSSESAAAPRPPAFPPLVFDAKALVGIGDRQSERAVNVQLADGYLAVTAAASPNDVMYRQPYDGIGSIAYSLSRHPLWLSQNGPTPAARTGRVLGIFARARHWLTLRSADAADPLTIVLRFENGEQVKHVVSALAERTGRTAVRVVEPKDPK